MIEQLLPLTVARSRSLTSELIRAIVAIMATVGKDVEVFMEELIESFVVMYLSANNLYLHLYAICGNSKSTEV